MGKVKLKPLGCPWCGEAPEVYPKNWRVEGNAFGQVRCENDDCPAQPVVNDCEGVCDERGSEAYKQAAIRKWNTRTPSEAVLVEALEALVDGRAGARNNAKNILAAAKGERV